MEMLYTTGLRGFRKEKAIHLDGDFDHIQWSFVKAGEFLAIAMSNCAGTIVVDLTYLD